MKERLSGLNKLLIITLAVAALGLAGCQAVSPQPVEATPTRATYTQEYYLPYVPGGCGSGTLALTRFIDGGYDQIEAKDLQPECYPEHLKAAMEASRSRLSEILPFLSPPARQRYDQTPVYPLLGTINTMAACDENLASSVTIVPAVACTRSTDEDKRFILVADNQEAGTFDHESFHAVTQYPDGQYSVGNTVISVNQPLQDPFVLTAPITCAPEEVFTRPDFTTCLAHLYDWDKYGHTATVSGYVLQEYLAALFAGDNNFAYFRDNASPYLASDPFALSRMHAFFYEPQNGAGLINSVNNADWSETFMLVGLAYLRDINPDPMDLGDTRVRQELENMGRNFLFSTLGYRTKEPAISVK